MKRSDLPSPALVLVPSTGRDVMLLGGRASPTHCFGVVELPTGLPDDAVVASEVLYTRDQPLIALVVPARMVERIEYETLVAITAAEDEDKARTLTAARSFLACAGYQVGAIADPIHLAVEAAFGAQQAGAGALAVAQDAMALLPPDATNFERGVSFGVAMALAFGSGPQVAGTPAS